MSFIPKTAMQKKLLLLYIAREFKYPLTEEQFINIITENDWMSFFDYKDNIMELLSSGQLCYQQSGEINIYSLSNEGEQALELFAKDLPPSTKDAVKDYLEQNSERIQNETLLESSFHYTLWGNYEVDLHVREKGSKLMSVSLIVDDEQTASRICENWKESSPEFYMSLIETLKK